MVQAYGIGCYVNAAPAAITGNNPPPSTYVGQLGQLWFDKSVSPYVSYLYNGQTWTNAVYSNVVLASGATPQTANGRAISVTFTGVSIAAGAVQAFVIANSAIAVGTLLDITMVGATTGSALSIQSVVNIAGQSTITVTNGTGATTTTANITFTILLIN